jgi:hypothetical protein
VLLSTSSLSHRILPHPNFESFSLISTDTLLELEVSKIKALKAKMATPKITLPGRLGDSSMSAATEPRLHPQILAGLSFLGGGALSPPPPVTPDSPLDEVLQYIGQVDAGTQAMYDVSLTVFEYCTFSQQQQSFCFMPLNAVLCLHPALLSEMLELSHGDL